MQQRPGNAQANRLTGGNGNDAISGNAGNDTLIGGTGNDLYIVDSTTDTIVENAAEGTDTVRSSVTFSLAALTNVENLTLIDTASNGTGNTLNNTLRGNTQNNTLNGGSGNDILEGNEGNDSLIGGSESDTLTGGLGNDSLTGNDGTDFFVLNAPGQGIDTIADFQVGQDKMRVSAAAFGGGLISGTTITANQFRAAAGATTAISAEHRFIYNSTTGALFYDADGNRTGFGTVQIATLTTKPLLSHSDIVVIA
ncbi:MAG: calcium-binding protein [Leptolyngbya sp. IPPAS B-1204]|nr:MAG: calcium-binding protein [Leptolyngbya sp. IPPAS B-1204]